MNIHAALNLRLACGISLFIHALVACYFIGSRPEALTSRAGDQQIRVSFLDEKSDHPSAHNPTHVSKTIVQRDKISLEPKTSAQPEAKTSTAEVRAKNVSGDLEANHGIQIVYSPLPTLPESFSTANNQKISVMMEFFVSASSRSSVSLIASSGDQELDAIAVGTARRWKMLPAVANYKPIDSKIRLRMNFIAN